MPPTPTAVLPTLVGDQGLTLRPAVSSDAGALLAILVEPSVARWWGDHDLASVSEELAGHWAIVLDGVVAGLLEAHEEAEPMYPEVAFDIVLAPAAHGRGHGRRALRLAIDHFVAQGHHRFTIDPTVTNHAAIRCYAAVGFRPVGILRQAEVMPDGEIRDGLLMDLLASELDAEPPPAAAA